MTQVTPRGIPQDPLRLTTDGDYVRQLRYRRGWNISDVVERLGLHYRPVHPDTLRNIETGRRNASPPLLHALAGIFGVSVDDLLINPVTKKGPR
ncbi:helix-turn-helix domain-containing protein [Actinopolyspora halophila]|uniref:helix-turn-helix domain-containing protein n=1 Tax=Actinopolyspora halophila TaxID=1850 RepID=UPI000A041F31|nr:helix-turn-helix transcriptional regulator [Actinopolyspora halophila]